MIEGTYLQRTGLKMVSEPILHARPRSACKSAS